MKQILIITVLSFLSFSLYAQVQNKATLVVSGQGSTKEEATANALRSAIEQAYGVFVSANTQILNDEIVRDEIATVASGNVKDYQELSCVTMPDGNQSVSLSATVSINNLITYAKNHGSSAEFAGHTFAMNIKLRKLNTENEYQALVNLRNQVIMLARNIYDCNVEIHGDPVLCDKGYELKATVKAEPNSNYTQLMNVISSTLQSLSLSSGEIQNYEANNMKTRRVYFDGSVYVLRNNYLILGSIFFDIAKSLYVAAASWNLYVNFSDHTVGCYFNGAKLGNNENLPLDYFKGSLSSPPIVTEYQLIPIKWTASENWDEEDIMDILVPNVTWNINIYLSELEIFSLTGLEVKYDQPKIIYELNNKQCIPGEFLWKIFQYDYYQILITPELNLNNHYNYLTPYANYFAYCDLRSYSICENYGEINGGEIKYFEKFYDNRIEIGFWHLTDSGSMELPVTYDDCLHEVYVIDSLSRDKNIEWGNMYKIVKKGVRFIVKGSEKSVICPPNGKDRIEKLGIKMRIK